MGTTKPFAQALTEREAAKKAEFEAFQQRQREYDEVRVAATQCQRCSLCPPTCERVVFGRGAVDSSLMIVMDHPDTSEATSGEAPVSPEYQLLIKILVELGIVADLSSPNGITLQGGNVSIVPAVKCLPPDKKHVRNEHVRACTYWLGRQIKHTRPKVIVGLGNIAMSSLTGLPLEKCRILREAGTLMDSQIPGILITFGVSPGYVIHRQHQAIGPSRTMLKSTLSMAWKACHAPAVVNTRTTNHL